MAAKRADYFEAGTLVVGDVDHEAETIRVYPRGDVADAEPAVERWRVAVDWIHA